MRLPRRSWLAWLAASASARAQTLPAQVAAPAVPSVSADRPREAGAPPESTGEPVSPRLLVFPADHGAHLGHGIEWWYATGWLQRADAAAAEMPAYGFQLTFFRSRTGLALDNDSRFAARQLLFAHAALSDVANRRLLHAERLARWNGRPDAPRAAASAADTRVHIGDWRFTRTRTRSGTGARYDGVLGDRASGFAFELALSTTQALLLQGDAGFSRKGPLPHEASHYYSQVQLAVQGRLSLGSQPALAVRGRAWLDHEWSSAILPAGAVGWDWIGMNLDDGGALTAFRLRDARGGSVFAGGSHRTADGTLRTFADGELRFTPLRHWSSAATRGDYPVHWRVDCPVGTFEVRALFDAQELDGRASTGSVYWEGLSALDRDGRRVGWGYLEMTGYAAPLRL